MSIALSCLSMNRRCQARSFGLTSSVFQQHTFRIIVPGSSLYAFLMQVYAQ